MYEEIAKAITQLSSDPYNPILCFEIAGKYRSIGQTAPAISFYLRAAEYGYWNYGEWVYASLLIAASCFEEQSNRDATVENLLLKAVAFRPQRPEAWFLLAKRAEGKGNWQASYTYAETGLHKKTGNIPSLPAGVDYPGDFILTYQKAASAWWVGRHEESKELFIVLSTMALPDEFATRVKNNLKLFGIENPEVEESRYNTYLNTGFSAVDGWVVRTLPDFLRVLDTDWNQGGGVAEIGVYMGRFFLLLRSLLHSKEDSYAIDLFEDQHLNSDGTMGGQGSTEIFRENLKNYDPFKGSGVTLIKGDSTSSRTQKKISKEISDGSIRFFSIDGGHTKTHTLNDLKLAEKYISDSGVVFLDDITHLHWLGVMDGLVEYLKTTPTLVPFAIGHNKLFLCKYSYRDKYLEAVGNSPYGIQLIEFMGHKLWVAERIYVE